MTSEVYEGYFNMEIMVFRLSDLLSLCSTAKTIDTNVALLYTRIY